MPLIKHYLYMLRRGIMSQYPQNQSSQQPTPPPGQYPYYPQQPMQEQSPFQQYPQQPPPGFQFPPPGSYGPPQQPPPKRKSRKGLWIALAAFLVVAVVACSLTSMAASGTTASTQAPQTAPATQPASKATAKPKPTPKPTPTLTPAQIEAGYKLITTDTTVTGLDKDGNAGQGKDVHFTCSISGFVKDSSGNTAGANVTDVNASGSVIQVAFTPGTDVTQMNEND